MYVPPLWLNVAVNMLVLLLLLVKKVFENYAPHD